mmetsp:Transcript_94462/g.158569  ORF Transcript_94462/g.158569 Transcript_94462/m.158569 type:complete len:202 (-) Transcript_94462:414-1019(-)
MCPGPGKPAPGPADPLGAAPPAAPPNMLENLPRSLANFGFDWAAAIADGSPDMSFGSRAWTSGSCIAIATSGSERIFSMKPGGRSPIPGIPPFPPAPFPPMPGIPPMPPMPGIPPMPPMPAAAASALSSSSSRSLCFFNSSCLCRSAASLSFSARALAFLSLQRFFSKIFFALSSTSLCSSAVSSSKSICCPMRRSFAASS